MDPTIVAEPAGTHLCIASGGPRLGQGCADLRRLLDRFDQGRRSHSDTAY